MMPSSSQVLDHQLIFHIMYGLGQFHHRQSKGEERRGEIWQKKKQQMLSKHRAAADGKNSQKYICSLLTNIERRIVEYRGGGVV